MVDATCDTNDLMVEIDAPIDMINDSLSSYEKEYVVRSELMNTCFEDESHDEAWSENNNSGCEFEEHINEGHHQVQRNLSKMIFRPWK